MICSAARTREDDVLLKKANEDSAALIRSIAERRGRNVEACENAVLEAKAYEESVALEKGLIDLVGRDRDELLAARRARDPALRRQHRHGQHRGRDLRDQRVPLASEVHGGAGQPDRGLPAAAGGLAGIYVEFTHPGVVFPGVVGAPVPAAVRARAQALPISAIGRAADPARDRDVHPRDQGHLVRHADRRRRVCLVLGSVMLIDGPIPELRVPLGAGAADVARPGGGLRLRRAPGDPGPALAWARASEGSGRRDRHGDPGARSRGQGVRPRRDLERGLGGGSDPAGGRVRVVKVDRHAADRRAGRGSIGRQELSHATQSSSDRWSPSRSCCSC